MGADQVTEKLPQYRGIPLESPVGRLLDYHFNLAVFSDLRVSIGRREITVFRRDPSDEKGHFRAVNHTYPFPGIMTEPPKDTFKPFTNPVIAGEGDWIYMRDFFEDLVAPGKEACFVHPTLFSPEQRLMFKISTPNRRVVFIRLEGLVIYPQTPRKPILDQAISFAQALRDHLPFVTAHP